MGPSSHILTTILKNLKLYIQIDYLPYFSTKKYHRYKYGVKQNELLLEHIRIEEK